MGGAMKKGGDCLELCTQVTTWNGAGKGTPKPYTPSCMTQCTPLSHRTRETEKAESSTRCATPSADSKLNTFASHPAPGPEQATHITKCRPPRHNASMLVEVGNTNRQIEPCVSG